MTQRHFTPPSRSSAARRAKQGLKLLSEISTLREHSASRRWIEALERALSIEVRAEGEAFSREGMVVSLEFSPGAIHATVQATLPVQHPPTGTMQSPISTPQGRAAADCNVTINIPMHDEASWAQAVDSLSGDSSAVAPLLAGEWPADLDDMLARHGVPIVPRPHEPIVTTCTGDSEARCAHVAAVALLAADRLLADPSQGILLRGLPPVELIERVRLARTAAARRSAKSTIAAQQTAEHIEAPLQELSLEEFWRTGPEFDDLTHLPPPNHAAHALLRRLGPSPLGGTFPLVGLLASAYDTIKAHAEHVRDEAESKED